MKVLESRIILASLSQAQLSELPFGNRCGWPSFKETDNVD